LHCYHNQERMYFL